jgi:hypothetical protein
LSLRKSQTGDELSLFLFLEGEHSGRKAWKQLFLEGEPSDEEEGVEANELTVDGKARADNGGTH